jgi:hypothetical protein
MIITQEKRFSGYWLIRIYSIAGDAKPIKSFWDRRYSVAFAKSQRWIYNETLQQFAQKYEMSKIEKAQYIAKGHSRIIDILYKNGEKEQIGLIIPTQAFWTLYRNYETGECVSCECEHPTTVCAKCQKPLHFECGIMVINHNSRVMCSDCIELHVLELAKPENYKKLTTDEQIAHMSFLFRETVQRMYSIKPEQFFEDERTQEFQGKLKSLQATIQEHVNTIDSEITNFLVSEYYDEYGHWED